MVTYKTFFLFCFLTHLCIPMGVAQESIRQEYDVIVVGGTPGGIAAAIAAGRFGSRVALVERFDHIGGMATSGLGKSDIEKKDMIGGIFKEFVEKVREHYLRQYGADSEDYSLCKEGYYYEPSVAEKFFLEMIHAVKTVDLYTGYRLISVATVDHTPKDAVFECISAGTSIRLSGKIFIDATYEGDLFAMAGASYRLGREGRDVYGEPHAGKIYYDYTNKQVLSGSTGEGDDLLPAYTYRLCLTTDLENSVPLQAPPPDYDRANYLGYFEDLQEGRLSAPKNFKTGRGYFPEHFDTLVRALSVTLIPNQKTDVNINPRPLAFPFAEENVGYIEGDWETRLRIEAHHRNLTLGLLYFLQNDEAIPEEHRKMAREYHLPKDEFTDNNHFPRQLYIREGRRLEGVATLTERDVTLNSDGSYPPISPDSIAMGEFPIDSFPCRKKQPGDEVVLEGYLSMLDHMTSTYGIPYGIMIPVKVDNLIVPVAASASHVAFSTIRMEPTWMAMGQAAGTAASLSLSEGVSPRNLDTEKLREKLRANGQVIPED